MKPCNLTLLSKCQGTTYSFRGDDGFGWALCTINDATGELLITSDWGNFAHRWHIDSLGHPTLTAFIGTRGDVDYLARKLQREGRNGQVFSSAATVKELRHVLCEKRLEHGRERLAARLEPEEMRFAGGHDYDADGLPYMSHRSPADCRGGAPWDRAGRLYERLPYLTRDTARRLWNELGGLADDCGRSGDLFFERIGAIEGVRDYITEEPWEYSQTEQTPEDRALRNIILPALIAACAPVAA